MRSNYREAGGEALITWVLAAAILVLAASSCTNDAPLGAPTSNPTTEASGEPSPVTSPTSSPASEAKELGIFAEVSGWIAYGNDQGIWAVNPTPGGTPGRIELSERPGEPVAWSSDGSKLLILRLHNWGSAVENRGGGSLHVLNSDGTETLLVQRGLSPWTTGGSFTPDGSKVIYGANFREEGWRPGIYVVDADGGSPRLLYAVGGRTPAPGPFQMEVFLPTK